MSIREHLLLGSVQHGTLRTGYGKTPDPDRTSDGLYLIGASSAYFEGA